MWARTEVMLVMMVAYSLQDSCQNFDPQERTLRWPCSAERYCWNSPHQDQQAWCCKQRSSWGGYGPGGQWSARQRDSSNGKGDPKAAVGAYHLRERLSVSGTVNEGYVLDVSIESSWWPFQDISYLTASYDPPAHITARECPRGEFHCCHHLYLSIGVFSILTRRIPCCVYSEKKFARMSYQRESKKSAEIIGEKVHR